MDSFVEFAVALEIRPEFDAAFLHCYEVKVILKKDRSGSGGASQACERAIVFDSALYGVGRPRVGLLRKQTNAQAVLVQL